MICQFYVRLPPATSPTTKLELSRLVCQHFAELGLATPCDIASNALLTRIIAHGLMTHSDHAYRDHV